MVKEVIMEPGRTFDEFSLLTGFTPADVNIQSVKLSTSLAGVDLRVPLVSAAMTSVTGYDMALALGRAGGLGVLPVGYDVDTQSSIVRRVKDFEMGFVDEPISIRDHETVEDTLHMVNEFGHSKIPVVDRKSEFLGMFVRQFYIEHRRMKEISLDDPVSKAMIAFDGSDSLPWHRGADTSLDDARALIPDDRKYLIVLDDVNRVEKIVFTKDLESIAVGAAISTHQGWQERVEANLAAGVDLFVIDSSDGYSEYMKNVLAEYNEMNTGVPICAGNFITFDGALDAMEWGADIIKIGMSSGSICTTQQQKATGRAPMTALLEAGRARDEYMKNTGKYVPIIIDGGIRNAANMIVALTIADAVMGGGYFNKFHEAAGGKLNEYQRPVRRGQEIRFIETWGEGSARARNLRRYGATDLTFFEEGIEGVVPYSGRLKPNVRQDVLKIKAALVNVGVSDLATYRKEAVLELNSLRTSGIVSTTHSIV